MPTGKASCCKGGEKPAEAGKSQVKALLLGRPPRMPMKGGARVTMSASKSKPAVMAKSVRFDLWREVAPMKSGAAQRLFGWQRGKLCLRREQRSRRMDGRKHAALGKTSSLGAISHEPQQGAKEAVKGGSWEEPKECSLAKASATGAKAKNAGPEAVPAR